MPLSKASSPIVKFDGYSTLIKTSASAAQDASNSDMIWFPYTNAVIVACKRATLADGVSLYDVDVHARSASVLHALKNVSTDSYDVENGQSPDETWHGLRKSGSATIAESSEVASGKYARPVDELASVGFLKHVRSDTSAVGSTSGFNA